MSQQFQRMFPGSSHGWGGEFRNCVKVATSWRHAAGAECAGSQFRFRVHLDGVMVVRALICCTALVLGLLAALSATAQSGGACSGTTCRTAEKSRPLDLMSFMRGRAKADNGTGRQAAKTATLSPKNRQAGRSTARAGRLPDSTPEMLPAERDWVRSLWDALSPHMISTRTYVNALPDDESFRIRDTYGDKYERLRSIKVTYDPENVFHRNANIT